MEKLTEFLKNCPPNVLLIIDSFNVHHRKQLKKVHDCMDKALFKHWLNSIPMYTNLNPVINPNYTGARQFCLQAIPINKLCLFSQYLFDCNCCKRHQYRKSFISPTGYTSVRHKKIKVTYKKCSEKCNCQCRHLGRMLGNIFIHEIMDIDSEIYV